MAVFNDVVRHQLTGKGFMQRYVFLSNAQSGTISRYHIDDTQARVQLRHLGDTFVGDMVMPMVINREQTFLYAALRSQPFCVAKFNIDPTTGDLKLIEKTPLAGSMANLAIDYSGNWLLGASFNQHLASLNRLDVKGQVRSEALILPSQGACHCIQACQDNRWLLTCEFENDTLNVYHHPNQPNALQLVQQVSVPDGSGPRHVIFSPSQNHVYVLHEMTATISTYRFHSQNGQLHWLGETLALPIHELGLAKGRPPSERIANDIDRVWAADIQITPDGRFIYITERTRSVIACLEVSPQTALPEYRHYQAVESQPRSFAITNDGRWMLVSGELSPTLGLYKIQPLNGQILLQDSAPCGDYSAWVSIAECH